MREVEEFWDELLAQVDSGNVIPVVGAELLTVFEKGKATPLYQVVAERLLAKYGLLASLTSGEHEAACSESTVPLRRHHELDDAVFALDAFETLRSLNNVHFLGPRPFECLPGYIAGADALLLPYRNWENARLAGLAAKFFEYLISGKPIITTPFTEFEIEDRDLLSIAANASDWEEALDAALAEDDAKKTKRRCALARENSEEARVQQQQRLIGELLGSGEARGRQNGTG